MHLMYLVAAGVVAVATVSYAVMRFLLRQPLGSIGPVVAAIVGFLMQIIGITVSIVIVADRLHWAGNIFLLATFYVLLVMNLRFLEEQNAGHPT
ncbi:MAG TPA: hypothetical protein VMT99_01245 [Candidatus Paceibacterota bacterium]|nr:hypothetical protein [Candidatus Paceibacterota bacterium]